LTSATADKPRVGRWKAVAVAGGALAVVTGTLLVDPNRGLLPGCPLKELAGLDCPLCGGTRAAHALLTGDVGAAIDFNVFATLVVIPLLAFLVLRATVALWRGRPVSVPSPTWLAVGALFVFGVVRNLPFSWAAPLRA